jgi:hypothetical protein
MCSAAAQQQPLARRLHRLRAPSAIVRDLPLRETIAAARKITSRRGHHQRDARYRCRFPRQRQRVREQRAHSDRRRGVLRRRRRRLFRHHRPLAGVSPWGPVLPATSADQRHDGRRPRAARIASAALRRRAADASSKEELREAGFVAEEMKQDRSRHRSQIEIWVMAVWPGKPSSVRVLSRDARGSAAARGDFATKRARSRAGFSRKSVVLSTNAQLDVRPMRRRCARRPRPPRAPSRCGADSSGVSDRGRAQVNDRVERRANPPPNTRLAVSGNTTTCSQKLRRTILSAAVLPAPGPPVR